MSGQGHISDEAERVLKGELAELHVLFHRQAAPILTQLARLEALKPPAPVWAGGNWFQLHPEVFAEITGQPAPPPESPGDRMRRLEFERKQLLHLLRMLRAAGVVPDYLAAQVAHTLDHLPP